MTEEEFWKILFDVPEPKPIFYRLYYNDDGTPICYSMEALPDNYIDLDQQTYSRGSPNVKVVNGKLIEICLSGTVKKLQPTLDYGTPCAPNDVCIVVNDTEPHIKWSVVTHETN